MNCISIWTEIDFNKYTEEEILIHGIAECDDDLDPIGKIYRTTSAQKAIGIAKKMAAELNMEIEDSEFDPSENCY